MTSINSYENVEETILYQRYKSNLISLEEFMTYFDYIVDVYAKKYKNNSSDICCSYSDLYQEGSIGLWKAALTYDPIQGVKFSTYASRIIKHTIIDYLRCKQSKLSILELSDTDNNDFPSEINLLSDYFEHSLYKLLDEVKKQYKGTTCKGIEAIGLRLRGLTDKEISLRYDINENNLRAWISKGKKALKNNVLFMDYIKNP